MSEHSEAPWDATLYKDEHDTLGTESYYVEAKNGNKVADDIFWLPDADLIQAAPELLAAAKMALADVEDSCLDDDPRLSADVHEALEEAVAKAEGKDEE